MRWFCASLFQIATGGNITLVRVMGQFEFPQLFKFDKNSFPSVILSDSEGFPRSGRPRGSRRTARMRPVPCRNREFYRGSARISYTPASQQLRTQNAWVKSPEAPWRENASSGCFDLRLSRPRRDARDAQHDKSEIVLVKIKL